MWRLWPFILGVLWLSPAYAGSTIVRCEAPQGFRVTYGGDGLSGEGVAKLQKGKDGFRNMNPVYIFDDATPQTGTVIWGGTVELLPKVGDGVLRRRFEFA